MMYLGLSLYIHRPIASQSCLYAYHGGVSNYLLLYAYHVPTYGAECT